MGRRDCDTEWGMSPLGGPLLCEVVSVLLGDVAKGSDLDGFPHGVSGPET
jgi:hypothetical protein